MTSRTARETTGNPDHGANGGVRTWLAGTLLVLAVAAVLVAGGWGVASSLKAEAPPARIGEPVEVSGGFVRVDSVTPEHMAPMQTQKFQASGMSMSSMGMDMAPEGYRRFAVDVTLTGDESGGFSYSAKQFGLTGEGMEEAAPIRSHLEAGTVARGSSITGILVFQAPEKASDLMLAFDGGRPVALDLPPAKEGEGHHHGGSSEEDGHSDKHEH